MVSLKSLIHLSAQSPLTPALTEAEKQQADRLLAGFGGRDNICMIDACFTRLRVTVNTLTKVNSEALQQEGALGVIILGNEVHAIFGKQSDNLRNLLDEHFSQE